MMLGDKAWAWLLQMVLVGLTFLLSDLYMWLSIRHAIIERQGVQALTQMRVQAGVSAPAPEELRTYSTMKHVMQLGRREGQPTERERLTRRYCNIALLALVILAVLGVIPASIPVLGSMIVKSIALIGFVVFTLYTLYVYWHQSKKWTWGNMGWGTQWTLVSLGVVLILLMIVMGGIRYSNPQTNVINGSMPLPSLQLEPSR
jgi:hypothetical protein